MKNIIPAKIISLVKRDKIVFSHHFTYDKSLLIADVEHAILNAYYCEKQKDELKQAKYKYCIYGNSLEGRPIVVIGKIISINEEVFFVITAYLRR